MISVWVHSCLWWCSLTSNSCDWIPDLGGVPYVIDVKDGLPYQWLAFFQPLPRWCSCHRFQGYVLQFPTDYFSYFIDGLQHLWYVWCSLPTISVTSSMVFSTCDMLDNNQIKEGVSFKSISLHELSKCWLIPCVVFADWWQREFSARGAGRQPGEGARVP